MNIAMLNQSERELAGLIGLVPNEVALPPAPMPHIQYGNQVVNVSGGQIGAINIGHELNEVATYVQGFHANGEFDAATKLTEFADAVATSELTEEQKRDLLQQVLEISEQTTRPEAERKPGVVRTLLSSVKATSETVGSLAGAWQAIEPILRAKLGL